MDVDFSSLPVVAPNHPLLDAASGAQDLELAERIGQALRSSIGAGAIQMLPEIIESLRKSDNIDAKLKFIQIAMKEGGFGAKEKKADNLPTFAFNFITQGGVQHVQVIASAEGAPVAPQGQVIEMLPVSDAEVRLVEAMPITVNDDFDMNAREPLPSDVLDMIDLG